MEDKLKVFFSGTFGESTFEFNWDNEDEVREALLKDYRLAVLEDVDKLFKHSKELVINHGLDIIYPASHKKLAREIEEKGMLITDFPSKSIRDKNNFIKRNRIIAGLSDATVVIESGEKGGSLVTADIANSYNRDVFAVPGRVTDPYSKGCNNLIKTNKAAMLLSVDDLEYMLGWESQRDNVKTVQKELFLELNYDEEKILEILKANEELSIDLICLKSSMSTSKVSPILLNLEFAGLVRVLPGKMFRINP